MNREIENITILFHDTYEELAKEYGYKTREDTKVFDMESPNGKTMLKTVEKIITPYLEEIERLKDVIRNKHLKEIERLNNIINELEEYLIEQVEKSYSNDYDNVLDKLDELKGDDKE